MLHRHSPHFCDSAIIIQLPAAMGADAFTCEACPKGAQSSLSGGAGSEEDSMRMMTILPALAALTACAAPVDRDADMLARALAGRSAGAAKSCVSTTPSQNLRVIDARHVAYENGRTLWVNTLLAACPSLDPHNLVVVERGGSEICRGDRIHAVEPGAIIAAPGCNLQDWVPYR
jgi:hypothetical protein